MTKIRILSGAGVLIGLLSISSAWAQAGLTGATPSAQGSSDSARVQAELDRGKKPTPATVVAASEPVVTIHGRCEDQSIQPEAAANSCTTVVTREAFEKLLDSMNVTGKTLTPETRRNLAETYAQYLALESPATKAGLESTPRFAEIMRWWRLRTLADLYRGNLQEQFKSPSQEEVHAYYVQHLSSYQRIKASRILIPREMGNTDEAQRSNKKALEIANLARERATKGESPELVQKDAYSALGMASPPITDLGTHPRSSFPTQETDELFSLESGQVSKVETEGASYVIYKIASKEILSEDSVKDEISRQIAQNKYDEAIGSARESAKPEFNQAYFGPPGAASSVVHPSPSGSPHP
jgi:PPIC-type PPIASE domain